MSKHKTQNQQIKRPPNANAREIGYSSEQLAMLNNAATVRIVYPAVDETEFCAEYTKALLERKAVVEFCANLLIQLNRISGTIVTGISELYNAEYYPGCVSRWVFETPRSNNDQSCELCFEPTPGGPGAGCFFWLNLLAYDDKSQWRGIRSYSAPRAVMSVEAKTRRVIAQHGDYDLVTYDSGGCRIEDLASGTCSDWLSPADRETVEVEPFRIWATYAIAHDLDWTTTFSDNG